MANLIAFDKNHVLQFEGYCKLSINKPSSMLVVELKNEEFKMISALFKWKFVIKKNILFVFADHDFLDFALVFKNERICQKVFNHIPQKNQNTLEPLLETRFLIPIFKKIEENSILNQNLIQIMAKWFSMLDGELKNKCIKLMKQKRIRCIFEPDTLQRKNKMPNNTSKKRTFAEVSKKKYIFKNSNAVDVIQRRKPKAFPSRSSYSKTIQYPHFKLFSHLTCARKMLIFDSTDPSAFHEYQWHSKEELFVCSKCWFKNTAILEQNSGGDFVAKLTQNQHLCSLNHEIPKNYSEVKFIKKPNYEIFEHCSGYSQKTLVIYDPENREMCYECFWSVLKECFVCRGCRLLNSNRVKANVCNEGSENEYIELINDQHLCEKRKFHPQKCQAFEIVIVKPYFEQKNTMLENGIERNQLIIYDQNDKNYGYRYYYDSKGDKYFCSGCSKMRRYVTAKVCKNIDGEEYVILSNTKHCCELQCCVDQAEIVLSPSEIELMENTCTGNPRIFVFDPKSNKKQCHVFGRKSQNIRFNCIGCEKKKKIVSGTLIKDEENGSYSFRMLANQKHYCQIQNYQPEKYKSFKTFDYFYFRSKIEANSALSVAIFHPEKRQFCFVFCNDNSHVRFVCMNCKKQKKEFGVTPARDIDGKEYFNHDFKKHVCAPIKVSTLSTSKYVILQESDLSSSKNTDPSKIIKLPDFELTSTLTGQKELKIFNPTNKDEYYDFRCCPGQSMFFCYNCQKLKKRVTAKLYQKTELQVLMGGKNHICKPLNVQKVKIIRSPNFKTFQKNDETKFVVFTSSSQEFCYEYSHFKHIKSFQCLGCHLLNKCNTAQLRKDESGEDLVELSHQEHACQPRKFQPRKYEIITESMYELHENAKGEKDKKLVLFANDAKNSAYIYLWRKGNFFQCIECEKVKKAVILKWKNDKAGRPFMEPNSNDHVCEPKKYPGDQLIPLTFPSSMFVIQEDKNGKKDNQMLIFASDAKDKVYKLHQYKTNYFKCTKCMNLFGKTYSVKLENNNSSGEQFIKVISQNSSHFCTPYLFANNEIQFITIPEKLFKVTKRRQNGKLLIFTSEKREFCYVYSGNCARVYFCIECKNQKKYLTATVKNGRKLLELNSTEHICEPVKFNEALLEPNP